MKQTHRSLRANNRPDIIAAVWGFAEATFFFIIPDVFTSYRALNSWKEGLRACLFALGGAVGAGCLLYGIAVWQPEFAIRFVSTVPGVTRSVIAESDASYRQDGALAILYGPLKTVPYKVYTVRAPAHHIGFTTFLLISLPARLVRFVLVTAATAAISYALRSVFSKRVRQGILGFCWIAVYTLYFIHHWI